MIKREKKFKIKKKTSRSLPECCRPEDMMSLSWLTPNGLQFPLNLTIAMVEECSGECLVCLGFDFPGLGVESYISFNPQCCNALHSGPQRLVSACLCALQSSVAGRMVHIFRTSVNS